MIHFVKATLDEEWFRLAELVSGKIEALLFIRSVFCFCQIHNMEMKFLITIQVSNSYIFGSVWRTPQLAWGSASFTFYPTDLKDPVQQCDSFSRLLLQWIFAKEGHRVNGVSNAERDPRWLCVCFLLWHWRCQVCVAKFWMFLNIISLSVLRGRQSSTLVLF